MQMKIMYQKARNQRGFIPKQRTGKLQRGDRRQCVVDKNTGEVKLIVHEGKPFKNSGSSLAFMARHGIRPGTVIDNRFKPPKGWL